ncbi:MAG TPA: cyclic pyranopterin monophosphate synthase MoaC [Planctomycetaceae bacterium]|nr:cyclic pyranopterin monophosphate synthase MoaC [Planctomycetaceae bacterium]
MAKLAEFDSTSQRLSHLDASGNARMVNVADKPVTVRRAAASATCVMNKATAEAVRANQIGKGDVLQVARLAAIGASKKTAELIPLCHSLGLEGVDVDFRWLSDNQLQIVVGVQATARTGVEMEAMVGASLAALTVYDMCKSSDRSMSITDVILLSKSGGQRGDYNRSTLTPAD